MRILEIRCLKLLFACSFLCVYADPQNTAVFSTDVRVVNLYASVHDDQGRIVRNLTKDDFTLAEDGGPQSIRYFSQESGLPLTVGLLVDTSISQKRLLAEERTASLRFLNQVLRRGQDRAFVIHFDREVELLQDLSASRELLDQALARLQTPRLPPHKRGGPKIGGWTLAGTDLYDAVLLASDDLMRKRVGRKALILLTDGVDNGSKVGLARAIESAQLADTVIYSILFTDRGAYDGVFASMAGKRAMQRMSRETGGEVYEVSDRNSISAIYTRLEEELRDLYSIGYTPDKANAGAGYRRIHLSTKRTGLLVTTRDGYYTIR